MLYAKISIMKCPKCNSTNFSITEPCPQCNFEGDETLLEELSHIDWLINKSELWQLMPPTSKSAWGKKRLMFLNRQQELEIMLCLRLPPLSEEEAQQAWHELIQLELILIEIENWLKCNILKPEPTQKIIGIYQAKIAELQERLADYPRPNYPDGDEDYLAVVQFYFETMDLLDVGRCFTDIIAKAKLEAHLTTKQETLEIALGLRPEPVHESVISEELQEPQNLALPAEIATFGLHEESPPSPPKPPKSKPKPTKIPLSERIWATLLSERTLDALFLTATFMILAAAFSFVTVGWENWSIPVRIAIPTVATVIFFVLGRYLRRNTRLIRSGMSISAVAALLVPIDFYTVYINFHIPPNLASSFWLFVSVVCLIAYIVATILIQSRFFGYLVCFAAGSVVISMIEVLHQFMGLSLDWRTSGLSLLAVIFIALAMRLEQGMKPGSKLHVTIFAEPFRRLGMWTVAIIMPITLIWRYASASGFSTFHDAMTINWLLGGLVFGWGAVYYQSHALGLISVYAIPFALFQGQASLFYHSDIAITWHAFGLALLSPIYLMTGYRLLKYEGTQKHEGVQKLKLLHSENAIHSYAKKLIGWAIVLIVFSAIFPMTDFGNGWAIVASHLTLAGTMLIVSMLWRRPNFIYLVSIFLMSAITFTSLKWNIDLSALGIGWASLAIVHLILAVQLGKGMHKPDMFSKSVRFRLIENMVIAGYIIGILAVIPSLMLYDGNLTTYTLGNWIILTAWGAYLAYQRRVGFVGMNNRREIAFHWITALSIPFWLWVAFANQAPLDFRFPLALTVLAWGMFGMGHWILKTCQVSKNLTGLRFAKPWYTTAMLMTIIAPIVAMMIITKGFTLSICLLLIGMLYFTYAVVEKSSNSLFIGGLVFAIGYIDFLNQLNFSLNVINFAIVILIAIYMGYGLWQERRKSQLFTAEFLRPLYWACHILTMVVLVRIYAVPISKILGQRYGWDDATKIWGAVSQFGLGTLYGMFAWARYKVGWGHVSAWLGVASGAFIAVAYSQGRGSSATKAVILTIVFIMTERLLFYYRTNPPAFLTRLAKQVSQHGKANFATPFQRLARWKAFFRLAWRLYHSPLLVAGWTVSVGAIALALIRNLLILGGGSTQQFWAWLGLFLLTGFYALSAWMYGKVRFAWFASILVFAPWTILTHLGWYVLNKPILSQYAASWIILAWVLLLISLYLRKVSKSHFEKEYQSFRFYIPPLIVALILVPPALTWGMVNIKVSVFTFALAIGFYGLLAYLECKSLSICTPSKNTTFEFFWQTKYLYPAIGLVPIWALYMLAWLVPTANVEHYGVLLLMLVPFGMAFGQYLYRVAPVDQTSLPDIVPRMFVFPSYLVTYATMIIGTILVIDMPLWLSIALLYNSILLIISAWLFRHQTWLYIAGVLLPFSLSIALGEANVPYNRQGWGLIALAGFYFFVTWALRRFDLRRYSNAPLMLGFVIMAFGLPPSSHDSIGALVGYGGAVILYGITAFWLNQPILMIPTVGLAIVPYLVFVDLSPIPHGYYGLALFPLILATFRFGVWLDNRYGNYKDFPWGRPLRWIPATSELVLNWWSLAPYIMGFVWMMYTPLLAMDLYPYPSEGLITLTCLMLMPIYGWAIYRFRLRTWLLAMGIAGHFTMLFWLVHLGWDILQSEFWLRFSIMTVMTIILAMFLEWRFYEEPPFKLHHLFKGWSRPFYLLAVFDILFIQFITFEFTMPALIITLIHILIFVAIAIFWVSPAIAYISMFWGIFAIMQGVDVFGGWFTDLFIAWAGLVLIYGTIGYIFTFARRHLADNLEYRPGVAIWEMPLQKVAWGFSILVLTITILSGMKILLGLIPIILGADGFTNDTTVAWMVVLVFTFIGLIYMGASFIYSRLRLAYGASWLILLAWLVFILQIGQLSGLRWMQWYVIPTGMYMLVISYLEWHRGHTTLAQRVDYISIFVMMGSLFLQVLRYGMPFTFIFWLEGFASIWYGSARRSRRFLYAGMGGIVLATIGQIINAFESVNLWMLLLVIGVIMFIAGWAIERKFDEIQAWRDVLETWE